MIPDNYLNSGDLPGINCAAAMSIFSDLSVKTRVDRKILRRNIPASSILDIFVDFSAFLAEKSLEFRWND